MFCSVYRSSVRAKITFKQEAKPRVSQRTVDLAKNILVEKLDQVTCIVT